MKSIRHLFYFTTFLIAAAQPALAVQMRAPDAPASASAMSTTAIIERGGTVTGFDPVKKIVEVDKVAYPLNATPVRIHQRGTAGDMNFVFKPGMQIRFNTSKENFSAQDKVLEIWVMKLDGKPTPAAKPFAKLAGK